MAPGPGAAPLQAGAAAGLAVPEQIGRLEQCYDVVAQPIGKGGYALVYKGVRKSDGVSVAVKKVEIAGMPPKKRDRCLKEVHLLQQLDHPSILRLLDAFVEANEQLIIITEWAPGGDVKQLLRRSPALPEAVIWSLFEQAADGLRAMHRERIMHRDIKPANIMVGANGRLKLGDLGLGRQFGPETMQVASKVGTPYYVSPEVVRGDKYSFGADMWSMGCLLYELATGRSPFEMEGANLLQVFEAVSKGSYERLPAHFSERLHQLVARLLQLSPEARPSAEEAWAVAKAAVAAQGPAVHVDTSLLSEQLTAQLSLLATMVNQATHSGQQAPAGPSPPWGALRQLHPLFFALPQQPQRHAAQVFMQPPEQAHEQAQLLQVAVFVQVAAWLLRLNGKLDAAQAAVAHLQFTQQTQSQQQQQQQQQRQQQSPTRPGISRSSSKIGSESRSRQRRRSSNGNAAAEAKPSTMQLPEDRTRACICTDSTKAAEAIKRGAQAVGLSTDFASTAALAKGHGHAVCALLQGLVHAALARQRGPLCRAPIYQQEADDEVAELSDSDQAADIAASAAAQAEEQEDTEWQWQADGLSQAAMAERRASSLHAGASAQPAACSVIQAQVDTATWQLEVERLSQQLSRIQLPAASTAGDAWQEHWKELQACHHSIQEGCGGLASVLGPMQAAVVADLERLVSREAQLNQEHAALLGGLRAQQLQLQALHQQREAAEQSISGRHAQLQRLMQLLEQTQAGVQQRGNALSGAQALVQLREAVRELKREIHDMDVRIGFVRHQLDCRGMRHAAAAGDQHQHLGHRLLLDAG